MYTNENVQNKCEKSSKHSVRTETYYKHKLLKYRKHIFTSPKSKTSADSVSESYEHSY